ncbi:MAG TPA: M2 family metallopeptidase [Polyangiaceae bacterium]|nr:M2 family metallopeptidase [Polyangiaceae bacterium]
MNSRLASRLAFLTFLVAANCGGPQDCPRAATAPMPASPAATTAAPSAQANAAPTVEEARAFLDGVDKELRRLWIARDRAGWVNQNFITDDTEALSAAGEEATAEYVGRVIKESGRFELLPLPDDQKRQLRLLKLAQTVPAPSSAVERAELANVETWMTSTYGKGKYCPPKLGGKCQNLDELSKILRTSRKYDELLEAWTGWHSIAPPMREKFARYAELGNKGAREIGFADMGALWRSGYDMPAADFEADIERLWRDTKPLYDQLHCYVRARLRKKYGADKIGERAAIPAHLLGNMWAQDWVHVYDLVEPYPGQPSLDVSKKLKDKKLEGAAMVKVGEKFFTSLGFDALPDSFWKRSLFVRPKDRDVVCHASAWDVSYANDLRIKMCIEPTEEDLITVHHELGHDYYFNQYYKMPMLFQSGANDGFHEGIGDTLALSVTPAYLKSIGLLDNVADNGKAAINQQLKMALDKIAFLPFGLLVDKWRWDVFAGKTPTEKYNAAWWELRKQYQGVTAPVARSEADFDAGAKFHVPASTPYIRYFLARIYQFQFHRALCKAAGHKGSLETCSIYGNKEAGAKLKAMLALGASRPWPEAMRALSGETKGDATAMLEYFTPLAKWLENENKAEKCGW